MPSPFLKLSSIKEMSKMLCILVCASLSLTLITTPLKAQTSFNDTTDSISSGSNTSKFEIGIAAGASFNDFSKGQPHTGSNTGLTAGLSLNFKVYKNFSLQLEANYLQQGGSMLLFRDDTRIGLPESLDTKNVTNSTYKLNTLDVPLLLNYSFNIKQTWKPTIYAGGSYGYTFDVQEKYQKTGDLLPGEDIIATVSETRNATSNFNASRASFIAGANLKLPLTTKLLLLVDMRYVNGLTPARERYSYMDKIGFGSNIRANSFLTRIGIILPLTSKSNK